MVAVARGPAGFARAIGCVVQNSGWRGIQPTAVATA
jgi:hypothetical protein